MPKQLDDMVKALRRQGHSESSAWAIAQARAKKQPAKKRARRKK